MPNFALSLINLTERRVLILLLRILTFLYQQILIVECRKEKINDKCLKMILNFKTYTLLKQ